MRVARVATDRHSFGGGGRVAVRRLIYFVLACAPLPIGVGCGAGVETQRHPDKVFGKREADLREYIRRINAGEVYHEDKRGYTVPQFLIDAGATVVKKQDDGCIVIFFDFLPTDAVPELWYSERGFDPLPAGLQARKRRPFFHWQPLAPDWGYCKWDQ